MLTSKPTEQVSGLERQSRGQEWSTLLTSKSQIVVWCERGKSDMFSNISKAKLALHNYEVNLGAHDKWF